ncbi:histidine kinase [Halomicronema hongdechloris C2206]|uniref:Histidine kinase n=1 Tax=Halomicronema hongdechloris C2206 TaxID=1641165 RepID=A0A1Z3HVF8_9CYAN|nr:DICT sensory domain-containing protein [Halomicronema hongdechloris]ASC74255.1 histidine kinase [Halomicronema hongdechloris C2206]
MIEGSILKQLVDLHTNQQGQTPLNFGVYYKNTLVALCHALEDCVLATDTPPLMLTAFQRGRWYLQEADRYGQIAPKTKHIVIMAAADAGFRQHPTSQQDTVSLVELIPDDPVTHEWHLMILSPSYSAMVLCQELQPDEYGPQGPPENDLERKFYGLWTFDPALVKYAVELGIAHIGHYDAQLQDALKQHQQEILRVNPNLSPGDSAMGISTVVSQVVNYLHSNRQQLGKQTALALSDPLSQNLSSNELQAFLRMAQLVDLVDSENPLAAAEVTSLLEMMGQLVDLPAWQLQRLRLAGLLHRIAPLSSQIPSDGLSCPLDPGIQALRVMPRLRAVATIITHQYECWDGSGQPAGLARDAIPVESRMLGLVSEFQRQAIRLSASSEGLANGQLQPLPSSSVLTQALEHCQADKGRRWDPKLVEILSLMVQGLQQGLSLPSLPPKMTLGTGLLNPDIVDPGDFSIPKVSTPASVGD